MKNVCLMLLSTVMLAGCQFEAVDAGKVGVLIRKPYTSIGPEGVSDEELPTGRHLIAASSEIFEYDGRPFRADETFADLVTSDRTPVHFNSYVQMKIDPGKAPLLHKSFGPSWYKNNVQEAFRTMIRRFAQSKPLTELTSNADVSDAGQMAITTELAGHIKTAGLPVTVIAVVIGSITPPKEVLQETSNTAAQEQRKLTEDKRKLAEDARRDAEKSKAIADSAYIKGLDITANEYIELRKIENQRELLEVIKDRPNVNVIVNAGGGPSPVGTFSAGK